MVCVRVIDFVCVFERERVCVYIHAYTNTYIHTYIYTGADSGSVTEKCDGNIHTHTPMHTYIHNRRTQALWLKGVIGTYTYIHYTHTYMLNTGADTGSVAEKCDGPAKEGAVGNVDVKAAKVCVNKMHTYVCV
jgi:hypothetical protein